MLNSYKGQSRAGATLSKSKRVFLNESQLLQEPADVSWYQGQYTNCNKHFCSIRHTSPQALRTLQGKLKPNNSFFNCSLTTLNIYFIFENLERKFVSYLLILNFNPNIDCKIVKLETTLVQPFHLRDKEIRGIG